MALDTDLFVGGVFGGALAALGAAAILAVLLIYVYVAIALMVIAQKTKTKNPWLAWIPIANFYLLTQIAKVSGIWTFALLLAFIPMVGGLILWIATIWLFWRVCERMKFPGWVSLLMIIPVLNLIVLGIIAWYKK